MGMKLSRWYQGANKKVLFGVAIVALVVGTLIASQLPGALTYYVTVDELVAKGEDAKGDRIRVSGLVRTGSVEHDVTNNLSFVLYYGQAGASVPVRYRGIVPDMFHEEGEVVVEGVWKVDGVFHATNLLAQHPPEFKILERTPEASMAPTNDDARI